MTRILIIDDHQVVREGLKSILSKVPGFSVVAEASDEEQTMSVLGSLPCDVALLDIVMPGKDGLEILKQIKSVSPTLPVLVLSMHSEDEFGIRAMRAGASGYLGKDSSPETFAEAIRSVLRGGWYISPNLSEKLALRLTIPHRTPHETLSNREYQTLCLLGRGATISDIAAQFALSTKTVSTYRARVLEKLDLRTTPQLIVYAIRHNLVE
jgi:two-component system invasion response regulator UvrY